MNSNSNQDPNAWGYGKPTKREGELEIKADGIYKFSKDFGDEKIAKYIDLIELNCDIDDGKYGAVLAFDTGSEVKKIDVKRSQYKRFKNLLELIDDGVDVDEKNVRDVCEALSDKQKTLKETLVHHRIGYGIYQGKPVYKLTQGIGVDSQYRGDLKIEPTGDWEVYKSMLINHVFPYIPLQFILAVSLSAVLLGRLRNYLDMESAFVHLLGDSSSGKSTATKLAISLFASPDVKEETLISTFDATKNALTGMIKKLNGIIFAMDELSTNADSDFTKLVYNVCSGKEKARMNADAEMKARETWNVVVISNGEKSIIDNSRKNTGVQMRVYELSIPQWTDSAAHSESINAVIKANYAHLGGMFAETVYGRSDKMLQKTVDSQREKLLEIMEKKNGRDSFTERHIKFYALVLHAAIICKKDFGLPFDIKGMKKFIAEQEMKAVRVRNIEEDFMSFLKDYIGKSQKYFIFDYETGNESQGKNSTGDNYYGVIKKKIKKECSVVELLPSIFEEIVHLYGHEDKNVIIKKLKDKNLLDHEKDRNTRSRRINGIQHELYIIRLTDELIVEK